MLKKVSLLLLWVFVTAFALANTSNNFPVSSNGGPGCDLPAPLNFHVIETGTTWFRVGWNPVNPGLFDHRVKTIKAIGNVVVSDIVVPSSDNEVLITPPLQPGVDYYCVINAICTDGSDSKYTTQTPNFRGIITDVIVSGITPSTQNPTCTINGANQSCDYYLTQGVETTWEVYNTNNPIVKRPFLTLKNYPTNTLRVEVSDGIGFFQFYIDNNQATTDPRRGNEYEIKMPTLGGSVQIGTFVMSSYIDGTTAYGRLTCTSLNAGYTIIRRSDGPESPTKPAPLQGIGTSDRGENGSTPASWVASPNPFNETLDVSLDQVLESPARVQLLNLNGQVVLDQQVAAGEPGITLSTAHLAPGFYMLRLEANGKVQTLKVVKSE